MSSKPRPMLAALAFAAIVAMALAAARPVHAQFEVLVVDRVGEVSSSLPASQPVATLGTLAVGSRVQLARGASLTLLYLGSGDEYTVTGPGDALVDAGGVAASGEAVATRRAPSPGRTLQLRSDSVVMAGLVARSGGLRIRAPEGVLTVPPARLVWESLASRARYRVEIRDEAGAVLYEQSGNGLSMAFPDLPLRTEQFYTWSVAPETAEGATRRTASATFSFAPPGLREDARRRAPVAGATFADQLLYALWLDDIGAQGEARQLWQALAQQRPGEQALLMRARR